LYYIRNVHYSVYLLIPLFSVVTMVIAITRTKGVTATLAWLFAILALPLVGATLYILIANPSIKRTTRKKREAAEAARGQMTNALGDRPSALVTTAQLSTNECSLVRLAETLTDNVATSGNTVEALARDEDAFQHIESALRSAKHSIWAEYYIIKSDETGRRFLELLELRAKEGIEVRLLYDAVGSIGLDARRLRAIRKAGGRAEGFLPLNPLRRRWAFHLRNHRKLIVVDGEIGFTGGMNMGDEYSGRARRRGHAHFRDTHLQIRGPAVEALAQTFAEDWSFATEERLAPPRRPQAASSSKSVVSVISSGPDQEYNAAAFMYFSGIASSQSRCYVTSPYFIPDEPTLLALVSAAKRGVDVRLLLPARADVILIGPAARSYYPSLVEAGVRIFEYQQSLLHAKTMVVDGRWGMVGSANVDVRSFRLNFEVGALVFDPEFAARMEARFLDDLATSVEITRADVARLTFLSRFGCGVARLLSPLL
jgi:cardiolipin synthase